MCPSGCGKSSKPSDAGAGTGSDAGSAACSVDGGATSCTCCAKVAVKELTFNGNDIVEKDTLGNFISPEWVDGRAQVDQSPVSYARNTKISLTAKFKVITKACRSGESIAIKATATFGSASLEWSGSFTVNPEDKETTVAFTSNNPLPNEVGIFESTDIIWQMNPCNQGWLPAGTTRNVTYVTLGPPAGTPSYWTLLDISCRAAAGKTTADGLVSSVFAPFRAAKGDGNGMKRKRDGKPLSYWFFGRATPPVFTTASLLSNSDGTGRCGSWARFLVDMHRVHGVTSSAVLGVVPISAPAFMVQSCSFVGAGSLSAPFTHKSPTECVKNSGIPGQGKTNPQFTFPDHALVTYNTDIYDPSYGVGPKSDLKTWEKAGIAGLGEAPFNFITQDGMKLTIPEHCSKGFMEYTAVAGDSLASIAKKFGTSAHALYTHPYNAAFHATHPAPIHVNPGDTILIPREISNIQILRPI